MLLVWCKLNILLPFEQEKTIFVFLLMSMQKLYEREKLKA